MHTKMHSIIQRFPIHQHTCTIHQHTTEANTYTFPALNMFIIIHKTIDIIAEMKQSAALIFFMKNSPATSYVVATFHPTIDQCAPYSLNNTATPEMGMILQGIRNKQAYTQPRIQKHSQANTVGFIRPSRSWEMLIAKLVSSLQS